VAVAAKDSSAVESRTAARLRRKNSREKKQKNVRFSPPGAPDNALKSQTATFTTTLG
jgi:hypothetical protein